MSLEKKRRRIAVNRVLTDEGDCISPGGVEIEGSQVKKVFRLVYEQPFTEWIGGTIQLVKEKEGGYMVAVKDGHLLTA